MKKHLSDSYLKERLASLSKSFTKEPPFYKVADDSPSGGHKQPLFTSDSDGNILIHYITLEGEVDTYEAGKWRKETPYRVKRYHPDVLHEIRTKNPDRGKYMAPAGTSSRLYFPPGIIDAFKDGKEIPTLFVGEGQFKAFSGDMHDLPIIGAFGISGWKAKGKLKVKEDLTRIIKTCKVSRVVLLMDNDLFKVSYTDEDDDLTTRLWTFYNATRSFRETCLSLGLEAYLMHIDESFQAKGLDDLYEAFQGKEMEITGDAKKLEAADKYFKCHNLGDRGAAWLKGFFGLGNVASFYLRYADQIEDQKFTWNRGKFQYNAERDRCETIRHPDALKFVRVGCEYFKKLIRVNSKGDENPSLQPWNKGEIGQDYIKDMQLRDFFQWIERYDSFTNLPDHVGEFQREVIASDGTKLYNTYNPLRWTPEEGDCGFSVEFVKHIFGREKTASGKERWVAGLDYLSILYRYPEMKLPIIVLVNKLGRTGKSTFMHWLKAIYGQNASMCSNDDFNDRFNSDYASNLLALVDESFIDKRTTYEKVKAMTTSPTIKLHTKGKDKIETDLFIKFILASNDETNCIPVTPDEERFWVIKVPRFEGKEIPDLLAQLKTEIPAFLHYLLNREIAHENKSRLWFDPKITDTPELRKLKSGSKTWIEKEIIEIVRGSMLDFKTEEIHMTIPDFMELMPSRYERHSIKNCLVNKMGLKEVNSTMTKWRIDPVSDYPVEQKEKSQRHYRFKAKNILSETEYEEYFQTQLA